MAVLRFYQFKEVTITGVTPPKHGDVHAAVEPTMKLGIPGFEAVFAIAGLLAVAYLVLRQRK